MLARMLAALFTPRPMPVLLLASFVLGGAHALWALPLDFVLGTGAFWDAPSSVPFRGPPYDISQGLTAYLAFQRAPWGWPLLHVPSLLPPAGLNIFWLDAAPLVALLGKAVFSVTGQAVNLLGLFALACLVLPGVAMTCLLANAGQRGVLAMIAATVLGSAAPVLWFRWGNLSQQAQFWVVFALALYLPSRQGAHPMRHGALWLILLLGSVLTNMYLFAMVGGIWAATLAQRCLARPAALPAVVFEAGVCIAVVAAVMAAMGMLSGELRFGAAEGFGLYSMNLASPFAPQFSGVFPWLAEFRVGAPYQFEGFAYLGFGVLLVLSFSLRHMLAYLGRAGRTHVALLALFLGCFLFALSHRVWLGTSLLVELPLSEQTVAWLGTFRSSGRFFWPLSYALTGAGLVLVLRALSPRLALRILMLACVLQLIDLGPLRQAVAVSAATTRADDTERARIGAAVRAAREVRVFPSWTCVEEEIEARRLPYALRETLHPPDIDIQLAAARWGLPTNSVYVARLPADCKAERAEQARTLVPGIAYFYRLNLRPDAAQLGDGQCTPLGVLLYCTRP